MATHTGTEAKDLASELAGDANNEAITEQAAILTDAQTTDGAQVTRAGALDLAQQHYATTSGRVQTTETHAEEKQMKTPSLFSLIGRK